MFGEPLDPATIAAAQRATACDVFLVIGTSALVWPAAGLATEARCRGAFLVEINPEATGLTDNVDLAIQGAAGEVLRRVVG
jgi:NAD-dependent deacetylase